MTPSYTDKSPVPAPENVEAAAGDDVPSGVCFYVPVVDAFVELVGEIDIHIQELVGQLAQVRFNQFETT